MQSYLSFGLVLSIALHLGQATVVIVPQDSGIYFNEKPLKIMVHNACSNMTTKENSDACLGCFWRLSNQLQGLTSPNNTGAITNCTSQYLKSSIYNKCGVSLQENLITSSGTNVTAFCDFGDCIQRVHDTQLIQTCIGNHQNGTNNPVEAYIKTTSCVLCKTHCIDKKFKMQYEFNQRTPALTVTNSNLKVMINYNSNIENMCPNRSGVPSEESETLRGCDCNLAENTI